MKRFTVISRQTDSFQKSLQSFALSTEERQYLAVKMIKKLAEDRKRVCLRYLRGYEK